jgi:hypothetical protein
MGQQTALVLDQFGLRRDIGGCEYAIAMDGRTALSE